MTGDEHPGPQQAVLEHSRSVGDTAKAPLTVIGADARRRIGRELRLFYASVLDQPLPERFTRLIDELAADAESRKGS